MTPQPDIHAPEATGALLAETTPPASDGFDSVSVSPGLGGFIMMFLLALAIVVLVLSMSRKIRRIQAEGRVAERKRQQEEASSLERADDLDAGADDAADPGADGR